MTNKEALFLFDRVLYDINKYGHSHNIFTAKFDEALVLCVKALEKQIPRRPVHGRTWKECPTCKGIDITYNGLKTAYCPDCGQAIDWGEVEE